MSDQQEPKQPYIDPNQVGAVWERTDKNGRGYLRIRIEVEKLLTLLGGYVDEVYLNAWPPRTPSTNPKAPQYSVTYFDPSQQKQQAGGPYPPPAQRRPSPSAPPAADPNEPPPPDDDDIPF